MSNGVTVRFRRGVEATVLYSVRSCPDEDLQNTLRCWQRTTNDIPSYSPDPDWASACVAAKTFHGRMITPRPRPQHTPDSPVM